ncbi:HECT-like ubiquitin-conjugating enzyme-binding-domain-containing protein [Lineolata rhizophorae]|uniref:HECT-like ubiquitin-conjugating enzyme-binding-domain-containing protein n=1 Tax=Lineolata rhizophorae TaxID=578093 RepID=A0A6A6P7R0_9PEZI|nr:HECT-like ubiquitin-conjugating enzyme-binding-domain-containing protein [Lineolata rhizophorae]
MAASPRQTPAPRPEPDAPPPDRSIAIYAEHLLHTRTISVHAAFAPLAAAPPALGAALAPDRLALLVRRGDQRAALALAAPVAAPAPAPAGPLDLPLPRGAARAGAFALRLRVGAAAAGVAAEDARENVVPWSGAALAAAAGGGEEGAGRDVAACVRCGGCRGGVLRAEKARAWRDLPREDWAEMMEFWHCHKPGGGGEGEGGEAKGYAAGGRVRALEGVVGVAKAYFLVEEEACVNVELPIVLFVQGGEKEVDACYMPDGCILGRFALVRTPDSPAFHHGTRKVQEPATSVGRLVCASCGGTLGSVDVRAEGWRIYKWNLELYDTPDRRKDVPWHHFHPVSKWIVSELLAISESQGVRKFIVSVDEDDVRSKKSEDNEDTGDGTDDVDSKGDDNDKHSPLLLWLFTPDMYYSLSKPFTSPTRAAKIFWKVHEQGHGPAALGENSDEPSSASPKPSSAPLLSSSSLSTEELVFPERLFSRLRPVLEEGTRKLPEMARKFGEWNVALVERFTNKDCDFYSA